MSFFANLDSEGYDRQYTDRQLVRRMAGYYRVHLRAILVVAILLAAASIIGALKPVVVARGVDALRASLSMLNVGLISGVVLLVGVLTWLINWWRRNLTVRVIGEIVLTLRSQAFRAAADHDLSFYDEYSSGKIVSRITSDTQEFGQVVLLVSDLVSQFVQSIILAVVLCLVEIRLALVLFAIIPFIFVTTLLFRRLARAVTRRGMRAMANVNASIKETTSGIAIAKNFRQEGLVFGEFDSANEQSYRVNVQRGFVFSLIFPTLNALSGIGMGILIYVGGLNVSQGIITVGAWYLFLQSLDYFFFPVLNLSAFWAQVQAGLSAAERVFALIDAESQVTQTGAQEVDGLRGDICFEKVCFEYKDDESVLENFELHIRPGETVALVGHTGAGKSSIAKLIARFYEFQDGRITVDGLDIRSLELHAYRRNLGIVSQSPFLFSGTVAENICYACPDAELRREIEAVARSIGGGEWLESLPQGLDTPVGERGALLSMGQRQLVSLMRVLIQKPSIFILDEATASVDPFTEAQIQQALNLILEKTTSILIAHRLSTVKAADRIIVLEKGRIIEEGSHAGLMARGGHYSTLYNTYFRHQSLEYIENSRALLQGNAD